MAMNTDVKLFHSEMVGGPTGLSYTSPGTVIAMLDACLVTGFGLVTATSAVVSGGLCTLTFPSGHSFEQYTVAEVAGATPSELNGQHRILSTTTNTATFETTLPDQTATGTITAKVAPAGWEKSFSGTNIGCYKSLSVASTQTVFRVDDSASNSYTFTVDGYLSMTDPNTGIGQFSPSMRFFMRNPGGPSNGLRKWFVIANSNFVYIGVGYLDTAGGYTVGCFGDIVSRKSNDAYRAYIRGNHSANTAVYGLGASCFYLSPTGTNGILARDYTGVGAPKIADFAASPSDSGGYISPGYSSQGAPYPNGPDYGLLIKPVHVCETDRTARGWAPGAYVSDCNLTARICTPRKISVKLDDIPGMPGAVLVAVPVTSAAAPDGWYCAFIDIGRAWGN